MPITPTCSGGQITQLQVNNVDCSCVSISTIAWNTAGTQFTITLSNGQSITSPVLTGSTGPAPTVSFRVVGTDLQYSVNGGTTWTAIYDFSALAGGGVLANQFPALATLTTNFESLLVARTPYVLAAGTLNTDGDELNGYFEIINTTPTVATISVARMTFNGTSLMAAADYPFLGQSIGSVVVYFSIVRVSNTSIKYTFSTSTLTPRITGGISRGQIAAGFIDVNTMTGLNLTTTDYNIDVQGDSATIGDLSCAAFSLKYIHQI